MAFRMMTAGAKIKEHTLVTKGPDGKVYPVKGPIENPKPTSWVDEETAGVDPKADEPMDLTGVFDGNPLPVVIDEPVNLDPKILEQAPLRPAGGKIIFVGSGARRFKIKPKPVIESMTSPDPISEAIETPSEAAKTPSPSAVKPGEARRFIPIDSNNEQLLLGQAVNFKAHREMLVASVEVSDFLYVNHQALFQALCYLYGLAVEVTVDSIESVKHKFAAGAKLQFEYLTQLRSVFKDEMAADTYLFHMRKLRDDKVRDSILNQGLPDLQLKLSNPRISTDEILADLAKMTGRVEGATASADFKFHDLAVLDLEYEKAIIDRDASTVFGQTGYDGLDRMMTDGFSRKKITIVAGRPGMAKCLKKGTKILCYDGSVKNVEDIRLGDLVMGPDSMPRRVLDTTSGREEMFEIKPNKGEPWQCNESHVLSLRMSSDNGLTYSRGDSVNLSVAEYLDQNGKFRHHAKLWRTGVRFKFQTMKYDAYLIGLWLGDGTKSKPEITNPEPEIAKYLRSLVLRGFTVTESACYVGKCPVFRISERDGRYNRFLSYLRDECVVGDEKRIPRAYLINDRRTRLEMLAGLVDTDGNLMCGCHVISTKYEGLRDDILFLARSLGFAAYAKRLIGRIKTLGFEGIYWKIVISGHISEIPCKVKRKQASKRRLNKDVLNVGFTVKSIGVGEYFGFTIDGDNLFLLADFTVTHNSSFIANSFLRLGEMGIPVAIYNFEMDWVSMLDRMIAVKSGIELKKIVKDRSGMNAEERKREAEAREAIKSLPIFLYKASNQTMAGVRRDIKILRDRHGVQVIGYDLFKKMKLIGRHNSSTADLLSENLDEIQAMGKDLDIHQVLVVQINRGAEGRKDKRPKLSELKDSGAFEEVADNVLLLYRSDYYKRAEEQQVFAAADHQELEIILAKQRQGAANVKVLFDFYPATTAIQELGSFGLKEG